jgi:hypothetical protein
MNLCISETIENSATIIQNAYVELFNGADGKGDDVDGAR